MRHHLSLFVLLMVFAVPDSDAQAKRIITATRTEQPIHVDGLLYESVWGSCQIAADFTELQPNPGREAGMPSCIKVLYDDTGIYIGAEMDEMDMHKLGKELFERDNLDDSKNIDWFGVVIDCYQNGLNGYGFIVSASGVQSDLKFTGDDEDDSWDAVWDSDVHHADGYWTCEMKIPYSALRFPDTKEQRWGIQFGRRSFQRQEETFWNPIDPAQDGLLTQSGILEGITDIKPPIRLSATPFFAVYAENVFDRSQSQRSSWGSSYNGGMDVKYGISDAYTLDMTLIPDFGQVQSDNQVLNLSPFEVQFDENRQFFTEGTELFNRGSLFYSRRIGGTPYYTDQVYDQVQSDESVKEISGVSRLINATKISGRGKTGTGLGFFNAVSPRDHAVIEHLETGTQREVLLQPWTNYNIMVWDQNLKNNSYISLINTNVWREGPADDANVTGTQFDLRDKVNKYGIAGFGAVTHRLTSSGNESGVAYNLEIARRSGNLIWELGYNVEGDTYDPNDLGFIFNNNERTWRGFAEYNIYNPFGPFQRGGAGIYFSRAALFRFPGEQEQQVRPNLFTDGGIETWVYGTFKNFYRINLWMYMQPTQGYDYFEPRVPGRIFIYPAFKNVGLNMNSDARKKLIFGLNGRFNKFHEKTKHQFGQGGSVSYRINNHFSFGYEVQQLFMRLDRGFVNQIGDDIILGARDYRDLTQILRTTYTFNPNITLALRVRHNWTRVQYTHFYNLQQDGSIVERSYDENEDINFNAWTIDLNFRWRFAPGSDLFIVWKNSILGYDRESMISFSENLTRLFDNPQSNSLSVKAIYFIDFQLL